MTSRLVLWPILASKYQERKRRKNQVAGERRESGEWRVEERKLNYVRILFFVFQKELISKVGLDEVVTEHGMPVPPLSSLPFPVLFSPPLT